MTQQEEMYRFLQFVHEINQMTGLAVMNASYNEQNFFDKKSSNDETKESEHEGEEKLETYNEKIEE